MLPIERLKTSNTKENLWLYILSLLMRAPAKRGEEQSLSTEEKELYGWEIQSLIEKKFDFKPGLITPYRVLYRLEKDGFVKSELKKRRRVYRITEKGKKELETAKNFYKEILKWLK
jgi:DNA-binding PadR family transcriptional regulator